VALRGADVPSKEPYRKPANAEQEGCRATDEMIRMIIIISDNILILSCVLVKP
jgi:hypothetical protein